MKFVCYNHTINFTGPQETEHLPSSTYHGTSNIGNHTTTPYPIKVRVDSLSEKTTKRQGTYWSINTDSYKGIIKKFLYIYKVVSYYTYLFLDYVHSNKPDELQKISHNTIMYAYITGVCGLLIIMYTIALFQKIYNQTYQAVWL